MIACFFLTPTGTQRLSLRRYSRSRAETPNPCPHMPGQYSYHDVSICGILGVVPVVLNEEGYVKSSDHQAPPHDDPRWPTVCACGYQFREEDEWQVFAEQLYTRSDTGDTVALRDAPAGALWYADWQLPHNAGPDGHCLMCKTPGGDWCIDSRANNCTLPNDTVHRCWVRHGDPEDPLGEWGGNPLHVDKNGNTCAAGAGSIQCNAYHGFLHNGHLTAA